MATVSMSMPLMTSGVAKGERRSAVKLFSPKAAACCNSRRGSSSFKVEASLKEKVVSGVSAAAVAASMVVPDVAVAAEYTLTPSLKNFLLSIAAGTFVLSAIAGAIIGVSNFDPVKRA
ncbi:hypothetical protein LINGRAHAP2_LOCUS30885 [Linum grandiflorum]